MIRPNERRNDKIDRVAQEIKFAALPQSGQTDIYFHLSVTGSQWNMIISSKHICVRVTALTKLFGELLIVKTPPPNNRTFGVIERIIIAADQGTDLVGGIANIYAE